MSKKFKILLLTVATILTVAGCSNSQKEEVVEDKVKVTLILDEGGANDESFNQSALKGAKEAEKKYGIDVNYIESKQESDYLQNIETAVDQGSDLVMGIGFKLADKMLEASKSYPDVKFAMIDATYDVFPENMTTVTFNEKEAGYLAGLVIGKMSGDTTKYGFVGGMDIPTVTQFAVGYRQALQEINPDSVLYVQFANSFTDQAKGKAIANQMYKDGIDTVFTAGGGVNLGVFESAKELGKKAVGVDLASNHLSPDEIVTSALKNIDLGVLNSIESVLNSEFKGGKNTVYDLSNGGIGYEKTGLIPQEVMEFVDSKMK